MSIYIDTNMINIKRTLDGDHYVVLVNITGEEDGWADLTYPFDSYEDALEWAEKINNRSFGIYTDIPF